MEGNKGFHWEARAFLILHEKGGAEGLRKMLSGMGDCLVISEDRGRVSVHIHLKNDEDEDSFRKALNDFGETKKVSVEKEYWEQEE